MQRTLRCSFKLGHYLVETFAANLSRITATIPRRRFSLVPCQRRTRPVESVLILPARYRSAVSRKRDEVGDGHFGKIRECRNHAIRHADLLFDPSQVLGCFFGTGIASIEQVIG